MEIFFTAILICALVVIITIAALVIRDGVRRRNHTETRHSIDIPKTYIGNNLYELETGQYQTPCLGYAVEFSAEGSFNTAISHTPQPLNFTQGEYVYMPGRPKD